jgi:diketogulonate reductase-like aldo/keto reductase
MEELCALRAAGTRVANQVLYNLAHGGAGVRPAALVRRARIDVMAYSPLDEGPLARHPAVAAVAKEQASPPRRWRSHGRCDAAR